MSTLAFIADKVEGKRLRASDVQSSRCCSPRRTPFERSRGGARVRALDVRPGRDRDAGRAAACRM